MTVTINGDPREIPTGLTVSKMIEHLGLHPQLIVVEHNREILDRKQFEQTAVTEGDVFELVHFVGGG